MTGHAVQLFEAAERLDESPREMLNGGATDALEVLEASATDIAAAAQIRGIETADVDALLDRTASRLRTLPGEDGVFPAAAEAATLLYATAWVLDSETANAEDLRALM
ncbi:MAG: hypothetical protein JW940_21645 [Polyangiaceae bacterium]|nr:hypothetical protein [Polyangiaceae bacterium]